MTDTQLARRGGQQQNIEAAQPRALTWEWVEELTGYNQAQIALVAHTVAKDAPMQELVVFLHACKTLQLAPLLRQAYWIRRKNRENVNGQWQDVMKGTLQVGIDGFRALADRQGNYACSEPATFSDWTTILDEKKGTIDVPGRAQVRVWKIVQGRSCCFTGEANWSEFYPGAGANGQMWRKMPKHQLAKCAEAQALRKGWPALLGNMAMDAAIGDEGETGPIGVPTTAIVEQPAPPAPRREATATDYDRTIGAEYDRQDHGWASAQAEPTDEDMEITQADLEISQMADALYANKDMIRRAQAAGKKGLGKHTADGSWSLERVLAANQELAGMLTPAQAEADVEPGAQSGF
jgi:phage recombination protein Bet